MRTREWRRHKQETIVRKRLKKFHSFRWYLFETANGDRIRNHIWCDEIGTPDSFFYKSHTTNNYYRYNTKYSPNNSVGYYRDARPKGESMGTRELDKRQLLKILKENGIR